MVPKIEDFCIQHYIDCRTFWVPCILNEVADGMTKVCNGDHFCFMLLPGLRDYIQAQFGVHAVSIRFPE